MKTHQNLWNVVKVVLRVYSLKYLIREEEKF